MRSFRRFCITLALALTASALGAQPYPAKPITVIDAFVPGGTSDFLARVLAQKLADTVSWRMIILPKPGANGHIGTELAAQSPPDGYTLMVGPSSTHAINPSVFRNLKYDVQRDFVGITLLGKAANVLAVHPSV